MNILLINPNRELMPWPAIPVGLCTVATALSRAGHDVELLDLTFAKSPERDVLSAMRRRQPELVGITIRNIDNCNFEAPYFYLTEIRDLIVSAVRRGAPSAKIVIGGSAVNVSPSDIYDYLDVDYAIVGEGEEAMPELVRALEQGRSVASVTGLLMPSTRSAHALPVLDTGRMLNGEPRTGRALVTDLTQSCRSEAWRWVDLRRYAERGAPYSIQTKRGCALKCSYCVYNNIEGHAYRLREPSEIVDEIEEAVREHGVKQIDFVDSTFNLPLSHARAVCEELAVRALPVELSTMGLNPAGTNVELVSSMKRAGFRSVMCTPEAASEVTLKTLQKGFGKHAVARAAQALAGSGIPTYWFFMLGAPGETVDTVKETLQFCEDYIPPDHMVLFSTGIRVYAGTPLEKTCKEMGWFAPDDSLFEPSWFISPEVELDALYTLLVRAAERHPNWMTNAEAAVSPVLIQTMRRAFSLMGMKGPFWQHLSKVFRLATRVGLRQRGLEASRRNMAAVTDVAHHR